MPATPRKEVLAAPAAPAEVAEEARVEDISPERALLKYVGGVPQVVAPFGELVFGEFVSAPLENTEALLATGLFTATEGTPPSEIRHP